MKPLTLISLGACAMLVLFGIGGCRLLWGMGEAAAEHRIIIELPGLMKERK